MNTGYIEPSQKELHESSKRGYVLGAVGGVDGEAINESGDWSSYSPEFEPQRRSIETSSCTAFAVISIIQILQKFKWGRADNYSERALAIMAEQTRNGNSPHRVSDTVRKEGLVPEETLPFTDNIKSWEEYISIDENKYEEIKTKGKEWLEEYEFSHEWVQPQKNDILKALKRSPLGISVYAWTERDGYFFEPEGSRDNHWTVAVIGADKDYLIIYDTYLDDGSPIKKLAWSSLDKNTRIKVYYLDKQTRRMDWLSRRWVDFLNWFANLIHRLGL